MTELPMSTRKGPFVAVVVIVLFVFISCALLEKSDQHFSRKGSKKCLRNCLRRQEHLNATRLSSCYHNCLKKKNRGAAQHLGLYSKIIHQRTRKALPIPHNDGCPDPSPSQTVDWSPQQKNVSFGKYENASHWYVNVSWTPMNDTQGSWNAIKVSLIVQSSLDSWWDDVNCSVHPKNQTFLQLNLSLYHYQYPNSIFVTIVALPYTNYYSPPLRPFTPPIPSTSRPTSRPTTASTSRPTSHSTTASTSRPTSRPTTASTSRPTSRPTTASTSPPTSRPTTASACSRREYSDLLWYPEEVDVHFSQRETKDWYANISWTPLADPTVSWKGYLVTIFSRKLQCFKVPKNQTFVIVDSSDVWEYPDELYLNVTAFPSQKRKQEDLTTFYPPVPPLSESASPPTSRPTTESASPPTSRPTTESASPPTSRPTTASASPPNSRPTTASTSPSTSHPSDSACLREKNITFQWYPEKVEVRFLQRETNDWYANISWTPLTDPTVSWKGYLVTILDSKLSSYHPKCFRVPKNQTFAIVDSSNGWEYPDELSLNVTVFPSRNTVKNMTNFYPPGSSLSDKTTKFVTIVLPIVAGVVAASVLLFLYRRWRQREHKNVLKTFKYHAFLIHNTSDTEDVKTILSVLESYGLKCCIHWRDFIPGKPYVENIVDSVQNSFKVIAILSRSSFSSKCLSFEIQQTLKRLVDNGDDCLILIALDRDVVSNLPQAIRDRSYIDFTERAYRSNWEKRVVEILSKGVVGEDDSLSDTASSSESHYNGDSQRPISEGSSTGSEGSALLYL
ncbi:PREDICTED: uncharacterized protein LOC107353721 isoform X1 [Acropora digitifera]|uniref:uncharacterized protein LOC107353721 isoform X1 n=1 Tax=Acropora digitifera TaxID=70779 RepID=UPI00077AEC5E|nr:PREDICTED: uncharacterized protein LOC107353721 isoform X1 [Acropora digitifera]